MMLQSISVYKTTIGDNYLYEKLGTEKIIPIRISLFSMTKVEIITKIEIELSSTCKNKKMTRSFWFLNW